MNCPCCNRQLSFGFEISENAFIAWCGYGPCRSTKANAGAFGRTALEALNNLVAKLEKNPDWSDESPETKEDRALDAADRKYQQQKDAK